MGAAFIAVIGTGTIGSQIAFTLASFGGHTVRLFDCNREAADRALLQAREWQQTLGAPEYRLTAAASLEEAVQDAELVIEAVPENLELKRAVFAQLATLAETAILATNSSSFRSRDLVEVTRNPKRLLNAHFYLEPWERNVVELMTCGQTDAAVIQRTAEIVSGSGLHPILLQGESTGLLFNRIWHAIKKECLRVVAEGVGKPEDNDKMWCINWGTPAGPFRIMDNVGLDVVLDIERNYFHESADPRDEPSALLVDMVRRGKLGRKTGQGFYTW